MDTGDNRSHSKTVEVVGSSPWVSRPFPSVTCPTETFRGEVDAAVQGMNGEKRIEAVKREVRKA